MSTETQKVDVLAKTSFAGRGHARWMVIAAANPREKGIHDAGFGHYGVTAATVSFEHEYSHNPELGAEFAADYAERLAACADAMKGIADPREFVAAVAKLIEATGELIAFAEPILKNHGFGYMGKVEKAKSCLARVGGDA